MLTCFLYLRQRLPICLVLSGRVMALILVFSCTGLFSLAVFFIVVWLGVSSLFGGDFLVFKKHLFTMIVFSQLPSDPKGFGGIVRIRGERILPANVYKWVLVLHTRRGVEGRGAMRQPYSGEHIPRDTEARPSRFILLRPLCGPNTIISSSPLPPADAASFTIPPRHEGRGGDQGKP
jgi:hypothetical protein